MSKDTSEIIRKICSKGSAAALGFQTRPGLPVRIDCVIEGSAEQKPFTIKGAGGNFGEVNIQHPNDFLVYCLNSCKTSKSREERLKYLIITKKSLTHQPFKSIENTSLVLTGGQDQAYKKQVTSS